MDIIVTTPKDEYNNAKFEGQYHSWFRVFPNKPTKLNVGDRIYFSQFNKVTGYGIVSKMEQLNHSIKCDVTHRHWGKPGQWVIHFGNWQWLQCPVEYPGFRGFRYIDEMDIIFANGVEE